MKDNIYNYSVKNRDGKETSMSEFKGKVLLIVNTASKCGFTPQYKGLQELYEKYGDDGLAIIGFPCDQFGHQEPGSDDEITSFCSLNYGVTFPMFSKIDVNGPATIPMYTYLKSQMPGILGNKIKWNFTKFLIDSEGQPIKRYASTTKPEALVSEIKKLLGKIS